jgi:hypothetical protein
MAWLLAILRAIPLLIDAGIKLLARMDAQRAQRNQAAKDKRNDAAIDAALGKEPKP